MNQLTKEAYANVLTFITNTFYSKDKKISVVINNEGKGTNYYDGEKITLSTELLDAFGALNLPRFLVYYHELGHHLYSRGMFTLLEAWQKITSGPLTWMKEYHHLINWIEDFYIEDRLVKEHKYLTDVINCIKKLPPDYDITQLEYAFNYYYTKQAPTPSLLYNDQIVFLNYIKELLQLRDTDKTRFGNGVLSTLTIKPTNETKFALKIIEFYNWCVSKAILSKHEQPPLKNPNQHLQKSTQKDFTKQVNKVYGSLDKMIDDKKTASGGAYAEHSKKIGNLEFESYVEKNHISDPTELIKEELVHERIMVEKHTEELMQRAQTKQSTLSGLFNGNYSDSNMIQSRVNVQNFFNPNRLADQNLFLKKDHTYMNVAIFRDISGSTRGDIHTLMHYVAEQLMRDIPVDITYYLYSSGEISIIKVPYVSWKEDNVVPDEYSKDPLYQQLSGGTNSDAIADVITEQLSDKWLNIIITDGDLNSLMNRENIFGLLKNVFVISVKSPLDKRLLGISVNDFMDIGDINNVLSTINLDR